MMGISTIAASLGACFGGVLGMAWSPQRLPRGMPVKLHGGPRDGATVYLDPLSNYSCISAGGDQYRGDPYDPDMADAYWVPTHRVRP